VLTICPWTAVPVIVGSAVLSGAGAGADTTPVGSELAVLGPVALLAVTTDSIVAPTSPACNVYVLELAPKIVTQPPPDALQSAHAYTYPLGLFDQEPFVVDNVCPCTAVPVTAGRAVLTGGDGVVPDDEFT
jgi:hypothetical protein